MYRLDKQEKAIVRELIKNPRQSDNQISITTKIPAMTVGRKRKKLESQGFLHYYTSLDNSETGTGIFGLRKLYIIKFKIGITASTYLDKIENNKTFQNFNHEYIEATYVSEKDGHFALVMIVDAVNDSQLLELFNGFIIPHLKELLGEDAIEQITAFTLHKTIRQHHSYLPDMNMENGILRKDVKNIFVDELHDRW